MVLYLTLNVIHFCGSEDDESYWRTGHKSFTSHIEDEVDSKQSYFQDITLNLQHSTQSEEITHDPFRSVLHRDISSQLRDEKDFKDGNLKYKLLFGHVVGPRRRVGSDEKNKLLVNQTLANERRTNKLLINDNYLIKNENAFSDLTNIKEPSDTNSNTYLDSTKSKIKISQKVYKPLSKLLYEGIDSSFPSGNTTWHDEFKRENGSFQTNKLNKLRKAKKFSKLKNYKESLMNMIITQIPHKNNNLSNVKHRIKRGTINNTKESSVNSKLETETNTNITFQPNILQINLRNRTLESVMQSKIIVHNLTNKRVNVKVEDQKSSSKTKNFNATHAPSPVLDHMRNEKITSTENSLHSISDADITTWNLNFKSNRKTDSILKKTKRTSSKQAGVSTMVHPITDTSLLAGLSKDDSLTFLSDSGLHSSLKPSWPIRRVCEVCCLETSSLIIVGYSIGQFF